MVLKKRLEKDNEVVVRRRRKTDHNEMHSGAWKVAFADFTMAMMALFMVLWVITPQNPLHTMAADNVTNPVVDGGAGIFDGNSKTPLDLPAPPPKPPKADERDIKDIARFSTPEELQALAEVMEKLALELDAEANIEAQVVPQGLRILVKDDQQRFMFERGATKLNPHFVELLKRLASVLSHIENKLIVSGHTDSTPYRTAKGYNNWNLSGDRALVARQVMVDAGLPSSVILQVAAQADVMPLKPEDPKDGANRRIEILLLTDKAEALYREIFGDQQMRADFSKQGVNLVVPQ